MPLTGLRGIRTTDIILTLVMLLITLLCLLPLVYVVSLSFSGKSAAASGAVTLFPVDFTLYSYEYMFKDSRFFDAFGVSVKRVLLGGAINFVLTILMAYPLARERLEFRSRDVYMWVIVFTMMFTGGLIPWYMVVKSLHLTDTIWALVLPTAVPIFNVILLMNFFRGMPKEINESAKMDGAGPWRTLIAIAVPLAMPAIATVTLFSIVGHWNAFFDGLILMNKQHNIPLQTYIQQLVVAPSISSSTRPEDLINFSQRTFNAAKIVVTMLPILIIYPFLQRYFVHGITLGSVKE
ncbi:ABC-type glycerol-3-phosphate transport system permease component [Paenibacillus endophyticus]|uniref:ABC-type glycerol-3-phosphate transport system permease component n=1 Tax=Paenibacillus endophyticus TaxID=1294268 RepID=A0A7W5GBZ4_9BACL|nr:carbohydrate ABC transporter permease [Paenibacillus endophyticus]MBB3153462.1 ABC-type glycerol-3-phosphate transport system permease component [Paenibacillus endophyticus]